MNPRPPIKKRRTSGQTATPAPHDAFERDELSDDDSDWRAPPDGAADGDDGEAEGDEEEGDDEEDGDEGEDGKSSDDVAGSASKVAHDPPTRSACDPGGRGRSTSERNDALPGGTRFHVSADLPGPAKERSGTAPANPAFDGFERDELETSSDDDDDDNLYDIDDDGDDAGDEDDGDDDDDDDGDDGDAGQGEEGGARVDDPAGSPSSLQRDGRGERVESADGGEDYQTFLRAILAEDAPPTAALPAAFSTLLDDDVDEDFDYMTAAAEQVEDPLEFRNDKTVHVTRREIVDLVAGAPTRRRRRHRAAAGAARRHAAHSPASLQPLQASMPARQSPYAPLLAPPADAAHHPAQPPPPRAVCAHTPHMHVVPPVLGGSHVAAGTAAGPAVAAAAAAAAHPGAAPHPSPFFAPHGGCAGACAMTGAAAGAGPYLHFAPPVPGTFVLPPPQLALAPRPEAPPLSAAEFWARHVPTLHQQLNVHVLLLAHVHSRAAEAGAKETTASLFRELLHLRDVSRKYKNVFEPMRRKFEDPLYAGVGQQPVPDSHFATPSLDVADAFLADAAAGKDDAAMLLTRFQPFADRSFNAALAPPLGGPHANLSLAADQAMPWTAEDDQLLALTIAKHSIDFGDNWANLLPHRTVDACQKRMRYLSSRRCRDNPVKAEVHAMTSSVQPLSRMEIGIIRDGLARLDPSRSLDDLDGDGPGADVWKLVQRDMLPHRDWRQLEKMWGWRQARRRHKRTARLRAQGGGPAK
jgi:hypothetical protein